MPRVSGDRPRRIRNISELAKLAGVSAGTVSRALAGKDLVNRTTRERIQALAREHGFRPNQMASRLRTGHTGVIGAVILSDHAGGRHISDPFVMTLLASLADELTLHGYDLMLKRVIPDADEDWLDRIVDSGMLDGVLLIGQSNQFDPIERVAEYYRPLVAWGARRERQRHCVIGTDGFAGGRLAAQHLLHRGRRHLAFLGDIRGFEIGQRLAGARAAIAESGSGATIEAFAARLSAPATASQVLAELDRMDPAVDGIVAASDMLAMAALRHLHARGRKVPDDVAVIGFDDLALATQTVPPLTTIRQDIAGGAEAMVAALLARIAGQNAGSLVMTPQLVIRESA